jgi:hypothetical protein
MDFFSLHHRAHSSVLKPPRTMRIADRRYHWKPRIKNWLPVCACGRLHVTNSTITENEARRGGGIFNSTSGTVELENTIVALNHVSCPDMFCGIGPSGPDCSGGDLFGETSPTPISSLSNNLIGDSTGCNIQLLPGDLTGDPGLGVFIDDGGPGHGRFPLLAGSQAIDAGNDATCAATDQLGLPRIGICDIGSVEFQGGRMVVSVDIRPKKDANRINPSSSKNVNVAIFSGNGFDAATVDPTSARFGATGTEATPIHVRLTDVDGDGLRDMVLRFQILDTGIKCGDTSATLTGQISSGQSIIGSSPLTTVQCKQPQTVASRYFTQK